MSYQFTIFHIELTSNQAWMNVIFRSEIQAHLQLFATICDTLASGKIRLTKFTKNEDISYHTSEKQVINHL
jgi:hypothetical protein